MTAKKPEAVSIGKFDILATYTYAKALREGTSDSEARERGMVAAIMGAKARAGHPGGSHQSDKEAAEKKKKSTITAQSFDRQVASKMGSFFENEFLPAMKNLVGEGMSYDEVKRLVRIPRLWGAKITGEQFIKRATPPK